MNVHDLYECPNRTEDRCRLDHGACHQDEAQSLSCRKCPRMERTELACPECGGPLFFDNLDGDFVCNECGKTLLPGAVVVRQEARP